MKIQTLLLFFSAFFLLSLSVLFPISFNASCIPSAIASEKEEEGVFRFMKRLEIKTVNFFMFANNDYSDTVSVLAPTDWSY